MSDYPCPSCRKQVHPSAFICCHCLSPVQRAKPAHAGVCLFCYAKVEKDALTCGTCRHDISMSPFASEQVIGGQRVATQDPATTRVPPEVLARLIGPSAPGQPSAPGGGTVGGGEEVCIPYPMIRCDVTERIDKIGGYFPKEYSNCRIVIKKYCFKKFW